MSYLGRRRGPRGRFFFFLLAAGAAVLALGGAVMALWNAVLPEAVHAGRLGYWQGVGLLVLSRLLFGSFGPGRGGSGWRTAGRGHEKWQRMSAEERQQFRQQWQRRARNWSGPLPGPPPTA